MQAQKVCKSPKMPLFALFRQEKLQAEPVEKSVESVNNFLHNAKDLLLQTQYAKYLYAENPTYLRKIEGTY